MAKLEDLALAVLGGNTEKEIAAANPYYRGSAALAPIGSVAFEAYKANPNAKNLREGALVAAIQGLFSGGLEGIGDNYQQTLSDRFSGAVKDASLGKSITQDLPSALVRSAESKGQQLGLARMLQEQEVTKASKLQQQKDEAAMKQEVLKAVLKNPKQAGKIMSLFGGASGGALSVPMGGPSEVAASTPAALPDSAIGTPEEAPEEDRTQRLQRLFDDAYATTFNKYEDKVAATAAGKAAQAADEKKFEEAQKILNPMFQEAQTTGKILQEVGTALEKAGDTGGFPTRDMFRAAALQAGAAVNNSEDTERISSRQVISSNAITLAGQIRKMFTGATTEKELEKYMGAVIGLDKSYASNKALYENMSNAHALGTQRMEFLQKSVEQGMSFGEASRLYNSFEKVAPSFVNGKINPERLKLDLTAIPIKSIKAAIASGEPLFEGATTAGPEVTASNPTGKSAEGVAVESQATPGKSWRDTAEDAAYGTIMALGTAADTALLGMPGRAMSATEAVGRKAAGLFGLGENKPLGQFYDEAQAANQAGMRAEQARSPVTATAAEIIGAVAGPGKFIKAGKGLLTSAPTAQKLFSLAGKVPMGQTAAGMAGRAGLSAAQSAAAPYAPESSNAGDRAQDAALGSALIDGAFGSLKLAKDLGKAIYRSGIGLSASSYRDAAAGMSKKAILEAKQTFDDALTMIKKDAPASGAKDKALDFLSNAKSTDEVQQGIVMKAQDSIVKRSKEIDSIIDAADAARGGKGLTMKELAWDARARLGKNTPAGELEKVTDEVGNAVTSLFEKRGATANAISGQKRVTLRQLQDEKKLLNVQYKPEKAYSDAVSSVASDFRATIEDQVNKLVKAGKLAPEYLDRIKALNKEESKLLTLRNALISKMPGSMAENTMQILQKALHTTGGAATMTGMKLAETAGAGAAGQGLTAMALIGLFLRGGQRLLGESIGSEKAAALVGSPGFRAAVAQAQAQTSGETIREPIEALPGADSEFTRGLFSAGGKKKVLSLQ